MNFEFAAPTRILFGEGRISDAVQLASSMGSRAFVVEGRSARAEPLVGQLREKGIVTTTIRVASEPTIALVESGVAQARSEQCDLVVALGGGSVIDAGKAIAALLTNVAPVRDYLEVVGRGRPLTNRSAPLIAIPTTAGTGAEVTRNAVLMAEEDRVKVSLRSALMLPAVAIIDPVLTYTLPPAVTASTGLDALTQCIEPFVSPQANPLSDAVAMTRWLASSPDAPVHARRMRWSGCGSSSRSWPCRGSPPTAFASRIFPAWPPRLGGRAACREIRSC